MPKKEIAQDTTKVAETSVVEKTNQLLSVSNLGKSLRENFDFETKARFEGGIKNNDMQQTYEAVMNGLENADIEKLNEIRVKVGLEQINSEHIQNETLRREAVSKTAYIATEILLEIRDAIGKMLEFEDRFRKENNDPAADAMKKYAEEMARKVTSRQDMDKFMDYLNEKKMGHIEQGDTDIAAALGEIQETVNEYRQKEKWKPEITMGKIVPALFAAKIKDYAKQLLHNIDEFLKDYTSKVSSMETDEESKKELMAAADEAKKADEELAEGEKDEKLDEIFERHLKNEMDQLKENAANPETIEEINRIENGGKIDELLVLENMPPAVAKAVCNAYRMAVDERREMA